MTQLSQDPKDQLRDEEQGTAAGEQQEQLQDNSPVEDDGSPVLDEEDLEENDLSDEEAEQVEWEEGEGEQKQTPEG